MLDYRTAKSAAARLLDGDVELQHFIDVRRMRQRGAV